MINISNPVYSRSFGTRYFDISDKEKVTTKGQKFSHEYKLDVLPFDSKNVSEALKAQSVPCCANFMKIKYPAGNSEILLRYTDEDGYKITRFVDGTYIKESEGTYDLSIYECHLKASSTDERKGIATPDGKGTNYVVCGKDTGIPVKSATKTVLSNGDLMIIGDEAVIIQKYDIE